MLEPKKRLPGRTPIMGKLWLSLERTLFSAARGLPSGRNFRHGFTRVDGFHGACLELEHRKFRMPFYSATGQLKQDGSVLLTIERPHGHETF